MEAVSHPPDARGAAVHEDSYEGLPRPGRPDAHRNRRVNAARLLKLA